jgi:hypothetical protein
VVREGAVLSLGRMSSSKARALLRRRLSLETNHVVRVTIQRMLTDRR